MTDLREHPADESTAPHVYARRVAYLGCPHKVRAATLNYFGRAPSLGYCERIVDERRRTMRPVERAGRECRDCGQPIRHASKSQRCSQCWDKLREGEKAAQKANEPEPEPETVGPVCIGIVSRTLHAAEPIFGITVADILSPRRDASIARARHAVMMVAAQTSRLSLAQIGNRLNREHSTVMHGISQAVRRSAKDADYAAKVQALREALT